VIQKLNRALLRTLMSPATADIVADRLEELEKERDDAVAALRVVMGDINFTRHAYRMTDMWVGACLSKEALAKAHAVLYPKKTQPPKEGVK
jgi:hypothetical protein